MNPKIINIQPKYKINLDNSIEIGHYIVEFSIKDKDTLFEVSGKIVHRGELDISAIQGKILYELKNLGNAT